MNLIYKVKLKLYYHLYYGSSLFHHNFFIFILILFLFKQSCAGMSLEERIALRDEAKEMFYHAYDSYMTKAFPADELMPLSCKGRYRDIEPNRGDVDDALGNFSLTLVDSLDSLVVFGNFTEFEKAVELVIRNVNFDSDVVVSVFETNIRMIGGLLSGHLLSEHLQEKYDLMKWYNGELLVLAKELGYKLLPAFNTSTGIPHPRINLKFGLNSDKLGAGRETCTSCAGTMILEFATLSRLTGEPIFELKARKAMDYLWQQRHRSSDLVGTVLNIHSGDWIRRESGVGAGIDSYYEYLLKTYILFGDELYLDRFNRHYAGIMKYVSQGPLLVDVHMHRPHSQAKNYMDSLLAFWPGLQVLKGDIKPAIETHEMLFQVMQRHKFLPEAFTTDFQVHWGNHFLRPEFIESTYFLYKATKDEHYLHVGKYVLQSLQEFTRVQCGFAAVKDVRTGYHDDRMDSFVLAETFKYLYLLFADKNDIELDIDEFVFTTEGHLLPLTLSTKNCKNQTKIKPKLVTITKDDEDFERSCPNIKFFLGKYNGINYANKIRDNLKDLVQNSFNSYSSTRNYRTTVPRLKASDFSASNKEHLELIKKLGITVIVLGDGRVQLVHNSASASSSEDAEEGAQFMQEMIALSKQQLEQNEDKLRAVSFVMPNHDAETFKKVVLTAGSAQFGSEFQEDETVDGNIIAVEPFNGCLWPLKNKHSINGKIAIVERGQCMFIEKARNVQRAGGIGLIVVDNVPGSSLKTSPLFAMSGDGNDNVNIPVVFLYSDDGRRLLSAIHENSHLIVTLSMRKLVSDANLFTSTSTFSKNGVPQVRDVTNEVIGKKINKNILQVDKIFNLLNNDISKKYADYLRMNIKNVDNKVFEDVWNSVIDQTMKTMQQMIELQQYQQVKPAVKQILESSAAFNQIRNTISKWIHQYKRMFNSCMNPHSDPIQFIKFISSEKYCTFQSPKQQIDDDL